MFYTYTQLDCALGAEVISEISFNRPELRPDTYLPSPYYFEVFLSPFDLPGLGSIHHVSPLINQTAACVSSIALFKQPQHTGAISCVLGT